MVFKIVEKEKYKSGDVKTIKKFAILPTKIDSTTIVWLERYFVKYQLCEKRYINCYGSICVDEWWEEIDRYINEIN